MHLGVKQDALDPMALEQHPGEVGLDPRLEAGEFDQAQAVPPTVRPSMSNVG